jgi:hypothetical protein
MERRMTPGCVSICGGTAMFDGGAPQPFRLNRGVARHRSTICSPYGSNADCFNHFNLSHFVKKHNSCPAKLVSHNSRCWVLRSQQPMGISWLRNSAAVPGLALDIDDTLKEAGSRRITKADRKPRLGPNRQGLNHRTPQAAHCGNRLPSGRAPTP